MKIVDADGGSLHGTFKTALQDSAFFGRELAVSGLTRGACINFSFGETGAHGDTIASFTGILLGEHIETMWFVVSHTPGKSQPWPHAVATNHDTFARITS